MSGGCCEKNINHIKAGGFVFFQEADIKKEECTKHHCGWLEIDSRILSRTIDKII